MTALDHTLRWERLALLFGIVFVLLLALAAVVIPSPPGGDGGSPAVNPSWLAAHGTAVMTQVYLRGLAAIAELIFVVSLVVSLRRARGASDLLSGLALVGGIGHGLMLILSNMFTATAVVTAGSVGDAITRMLGKLADQTLDVESFVLVALFAGASLALLRTRTAPRWIGWLGLLAAVVALVEPLELINERLDVLGLPALLLELIWFVAVSLALLLPGRHPATAVTAPVPAS